MPLLVRTMPMRYGETLAAYREDSIQTKMEQQRSEHNERSEHYKHNNVSMEILGSFQSNFDWLAKQLSFILVS